MSAGVEAFASISVIVNVSPSIVTEKGCCGLSPSRYSNVASSMFGPPTAPAGISRRIVLAPAVSVTSTLFSIQEFQPVAAEPVPVTGPGTKETEPSLSPLTAMTSGRSVVAPLA
ncbi:hypothetical protein D3C73_796280 [compost metagenome]